MRNNKHNVKVLEYWRAFESFVMPGITDRKSEISIEGKPIILGPNSTLPWPLPRHIVHKRKEESNFVFNVYIGLIKQEVIQDKIQKILKSTSEDYDLQKNHNLTCLAGFTLNDDGCLYGDSYMTPDFLTSLYALEQYHSSEAWEVGYEKAKTKFKNIGEIFESAQTVPLSFESIQEHIKVILANFKCLTEDDIKYAVIVHKKKVNAPRGLEESIVNEYIPDQNEDLDDGEQSGFIENNIGRVTYLDILPSYFLDDL